MRRAALWFIGFSALMIVGCSGGGGTSITAPSEQSNLMSTEEIGDITMVSGGMSEGSVDSEVDEMEASGIKTKRFTRTRPCPAGGDITVRGTLELSKNGNVLEAEGNGVRTENDCAFERASGTVTVNGRARWDAQFRRVNGKPQGPQITHWEGRSTFTHSDGRERTCPVEITITRDPSSGTRRLEGTICGRPVSRSGQWTPGG